MLQCLFKAHIGVLLVGVRHSDLRVCVCSVTQLCPTLGPRGPQPARHLCPWDFPGKNTGVGCHFLLQGDLPWVYLGQPPKYNSW